MNTIRAISIGNRLAIAAVFLMLAGFAQPGSAQDIASLVSKGGEVHLRGAYHLDGTLTIPANTRIICEAGTTISDGTARKLDSLLKLAGKNISLEGCDILDNNSALIIVLGAQASDITITHNHLHSLNHAHGILIDSPGIHDVKISDNTIEDVGYGILQNVHAFDVTNVSIVDNTLSNVWSDGIALNNPVSVVCCGMQLTNIRASFVTIKHNHIRVPKRVGSNPNAGFCVSIAGAHDIDVVDNDCVAWLEGIHIEDRAYNIKVADNSIATDDHAGHGDESAVWIIDGQHITVSKNTIKDTAGDGIHLDFDPNHQASDVEISGNVITGCGRYGLFISGGSLGPMNSRVHDNTISGCADPVFLTGSLKALSIHSNRFQASSGCVFEFGKQQNGGDVDIKDNRDPDSGGDANASCNQPEKKRTGTAG